MENMKFAYFALIAISAVLLLAMAGCTSSTPADTAPAETVSGKADFAPQQPAMEDAAPEKTQDAMKEAPVADVKNDTPMEEVAPVAADTVHDMKFTAGKIGSLEIIRMGTRGTYNLTPNEGNEFVAVQLTMGNEGSQDKKLTVSKPQLSMSDGKKYAFSYQKTHEAEISEHMPFACIFRMDEPSDAGFSAKAMYGKSRVACLIFEVPTGKSIESFGFEATVTDMEKTGKGTVSIPVPG